MSRKKIAAILICVAVTVLFNIFVFKHVSVGEFENSDITLNLTISADKDTEFKIYYSNDGNFIEDRISVYIYRISSGGPVDVSFTTMPYRYMRFDFGESEGIAEILEATMEYDGMSSDIMPLILDTDNIMEVNDIGEINAVNGTAQVYFEAGDSYILTDAGNSGVYDVFEDDLQKKSNMLAAGLCAIVDCIVIVGLINTRRLAELPLEVFRSRKLIMNLARNDFKTRFAGSYLGIVWGFIQPIVTILVYWFVFQVGLKTPRTNDFPFILWFMSGLIPWFFFSEAISGGTNVLIEYSYLVKKVVFKISILPIVKIMSSLFVNLFFVAFIIVVCWCYGYNPDLYTLQILYYMLCSFVLVLGITYITSAVVCFFRDLTQIISILLQVGMWMTPIMWPSEMLSPGLQAVFKLNPVYYIVEGFRDALLAKAWLWDKMVWTIYFWVLVVIIFTLGTAVFKKLRVHFADVL